MQLALLRYPGWAFSNVEGVPFRVLAYISEQAGVEPKELILYAQRENTRLEHLQEIREIYRYRNFSEVEHEYISQLLFASAMENDNAMHLMRMAVEELRKKKIILPGITTLERIAVEARTEAYNKVLKIINVLKTIISS